MVKINKIYTRTGDQGDTGLVGGKRVAKDCPRVAAYGNVDELNSVLGWARTLAEADNFNTLSKPLARLQNELFDLGAQLATPPEDLGTVRIVINQLHIDHLEELIDQATEGLPELRSFVLPGGSQLNSALHMARCICRRAERSVLSLSKLEKAPEFALRYLNRLSDYLFAAARLSSKLQNLDEYLWQPNNSLDQRN